MWLKSSNSVVHNTIWLILAAAISSSQADDSIDFNRDIRPILSDKCFMCHGPDEDKLEAGLRLDLEKVAKSELDSGSFAVVPKRPEESELILRISSDDSDIVMPPPSLGKKVSPSEIALLKKWIEQGADYAKHWSYTKPVRPAVPVADAKFAHWPRNEIDHFTLHRMLANGLQPSVEANRYALARRVSLDLTGLPPTVEQVESFVRDNRAAGYEHFVDRLLDSDSFGEHWARKWLDLARYADSAGYADDPSRTIWAYRDWVIRAINDNMPFDEFTVQQLAGDLLPDPTTDQLVATAFHRNTMTNNEGGTQDEEFRNVAVVDRVNTTMAVWMGTTMACAQCHNHKYDPISQEEYFKFFAIFNNTQDADRRDESPIVQIYSDEQIEKRSQMSKQVAKLRETIAESTPELIASQRVWEKELQSNPEWQVLSPSAFNRSSGSSASVQNDGTILVSKTATKDTYTVDFEADGIRGESNADKLVAAIQLETLPHQSLPNGGSGLSGGNFVVTKIRAQIIPEKTPDRRARFVRITNHGKAQILSLAEVEVFSNGKNIARDGVASQHSTAFNGPPELAIDGNTNGDYNKGSVTHTATVNDPWWELDLKETQAIERISIWNRTDAGLHTRLRDFSITLLDKDRNEVWRKDVKQAPNPSREFSTSGARDISFQTAFADYHQKNFNAEEVLSGKTGNKDGWAIGGQVDATHQLTLVPSEPVSLKNAKLLRVTIEQKSPHSNHLLGYFRFRVTSHTSAIQRAKLPERILTIVDVAPSQRTDKQIADLSDYFRKNVAPELQAERESLASISKMLADMKPMTSVPIFRERIDNRRTTHLQFRGSYLDKGDVVQEGIPAVFQTNGDQPPSDRLSMARWLVDPANPLTARVLANRLWESIFGRGIVVTSEEFGSQGELPSHPELLDWLATEIQRNGWDTKSLLKEMVMSATYRQSTRVTNEKLAADADNIWLSRGPRVRLSAEMIRDQALFASGLLSDKMYGAPVRPPQPSLGLSAAFGSSTDWKPSQGDDRYRRAIYTTWRRSNPYPSMATFDAPNREVCTVRRNRTNTPLQSLVTLNDPVYVEAAQALARKMLSKSGTLETQIEFGFRRCLLRPPTSDEVNALKALFADAKSQLAERPSEAEKLAIDPLGKLPDGMQATDAAAMTVVCNVLLNLDEMFLKR